MNDDNDDTDDTDDNDDEGGIYDSSLEASSEKLYPDSVGISSIC